MALDNGKDWLQDKALDILDAAVDAIVTIDDRSIVQSVNQATLKLFGYSESQMVGQPLEQIIPEPHRSRHQGYIDRYLRTGDARIIGIGRELQAQRADGTQFPISLAISEITSKSKQYFVGIVRDLSEQKAALRDLSEQRERLAQVGRLSTMGEMTASIAHEINQPLTAISMYAQASLRMLEQEQLDRTKLAGALNKLNEQALRAGAVIERIQRFVRHEDGRRELTDLNELTNDLELLISADARLHNIELTFELDETLPPTLCDSVQIQQVLINLIRNAIDAMYSIHCEHGHTILIRSAHSNNDSLALSVVDCGPGIPLAEQDKIFSAFHTTKQEGMGMGLSICRSIVEAHGGKLTFQNNAQHGCTFEIILPLESDND